MADKALQMALYFYTVRHLWELVSILGSWWTLASLASGLDLTPTEI